MTPEDIQTIVISHPDDTYLTIRATLPIAVEIRVDREEQFRDPHAVKRAGDRCRKDLIEKLYGSTRRNARAAKDEVRTGYGYTQKVAAAFEPLLNAGKELEKP